MGEVTHGEFPASSPVALDQWGIFELIIKESGDEGSVEEAGAGSSICIPGAGVGGLSICVACELHAVPSPKKIFGKREIYQD